MDIAGVVIVNGIMFSRAVAGLLIRPYETYRRIVRNGKAGELIFVGVLLMVYFAIASMVKVSAFRPFLLTRQFLVLCLGAASGMLMSAVSLWLTGRILGVKVRFLTLLIAWSYTLVPTVLWFLTTSVLYIMLPPPRTTSASGVTFSLLFLVFSATLLWWKITLSYLVIRFGLKLDLVRSVAVALMCAPLLAAWSVIMYRAGVFKVPFL